MFVSERKATILHADADAFFAAVEQRDDPRLRGRPTIVGSGVVMAASYEARAYGVRGAMGGAKARRLCPDAIFVPPRFRAYVAASKQLFAVFEDTAPVVEGLSLEEAFLDVRGLERISGTPVEIGARLKSRVREQVGLAVTVGIATTRIVAKMASNSAKPDGLLEVPAGGEIAFLHPLPVEKVWGVGASTAGKLRRHGIATVGHIARLGEAGMIAILGPAAGRRLHALAHNRDVRPRRGRGRRSFGSQSATGGRSRSPEEVDTAVVGLVDRVTRRMRTAGRTGRTVVLRLRFDDFTRATRSHTLPHPTSASHAVLAAIRALLAEARPLIESRGATLVGVTITNLDGDDAQLMLPLDGRPRAGLDAALDEVRERFGPDAVTRAALLDRGRRLPAWLLAGEEGEGSR
jgi:DNA polymerase IV